jgi:hypothetical protein
MNLNNDKLVIEELSRMKSLFGYARGKVISEQVVSNTPNYGFKNPYGFTTTTPSPSAPVPAEKTLPDVTVKSTLTPRQKNINNAFCAVKNGAIVNPSSANNGIKWVDFITTYKVTTAEIATSQKKCPNSEVAVKTKTPRKPDPKVVELQKQLVAAGYKLGNSGPNRDGIDGIMGPRTRTAQQQMTQQKGQDQLKQTATQDAVVTQPTTQDAVVTQPQQNDVVTQEPPTEPGQTGEYKNGWYWDEKSQEWYQPQ